ncbi:serine protease [Ceratobasidium sp. AG-I]|nr:serine protease [Ceratobasidium sp. AG-I]
MRACTSWFLAAVTAALLLTDEGRAVAVTTERREVTPKTYIVMLMERANKKAHMSWVDNELPKITKRDNGSDPQIIYDYDALNGYAIQLTEDAVANLSNSPDVASIVPDKEFEASLQQTNAPWGISRISRQTKLPAGSTVEALNYTFDYKFSGITINPPARKVDVYVIDTGVYTAHVEFGGRAKWGATFGSGYKDADGNGHGTHIAGTIGGARFGVAKSASIIAVKVLNDKGRGWNSDIIGGVDWAVTQALSTGRPSVFSISIGGISDDALNAAVNRAVANGIHVVVSAGNNDDDSRKYSPAGAADVITVGATNISDSRWESSNFGPGVDIYAPGQDVTSAWIRSVNDTNRISGTSMAVPHVSGLIAYLLAVEGPRTPADMLARVKQLAPDGVLSDIPADTINEIIWNGGA